MIKFEKVPYSEYKNSRLIINSKLTEKEIKAEYDQIKLPSRDTTGTAAYDFFVPYDVTLTKKFQVVLTGVRFCTDRTDVALLCLPRSGLGFKFNTMLANTIGLIDADQSQSSHGGHILIKINAQKKCELKRNAAFAQAIIVPFVTIDNDPAKPWNGKYINNCGIMHLEK